MKNTNDINFSKILILFINKILSQFYSSYLYVVILVYVAIVLLNPQTIIAKEASVNLSQTNILLHKANNAYISGDYQEAISIWLKLIDLPKQKSSQRANIYSNLASVYWYIGNPREAIKYWQKSLEIYRESKNNKSDEKIAATLVDIARAYNDLGQPRFSIPLVMEAVSIAEDKRLTKVKRIAYLTLGNSYNIQRNYDLAINAYKNSLQEVKQTNDDLPIVVWNNLSKAYEQRAFITQQLAIAAEDEEDLSEDELWRQVKNDQARAWSAAKKATKIREYDQSITQVEALLQKAKLATNDAKKSYLVADSLLRAETILQALPDSHHKVFALIKLGKLTKDYDSRSKEILDSAVKTAQKINNPRVTSFAFGAMGEYFESQKQYDQAMEWTKQAQFNAQQAQALDSLYQWDWQAARIYNATKQTESAIEAYERAIASLQSIRTTNTIQSQSNPLSEFQSDLEPIYRGLIKLLLTNDSSKPKLKQALQIKDLLLLSELENFFEDDCFKLETISETDKIAYLKKTNGAVINTIIVNDKTHVIWQLPDNKILKYAVNISQKQLKKLVNQWRFDLENKENDNYLALSQQLYKLFFPSEIESYLKTSKLENLIFVNDGLLRNVPMAALHNGEKFLVEDYAIANSLGLNIEVKKSKPKIEKALVFGLTASVNQFPSLPYVEQEMELLGQIFNEKKFVNNKFTKKNFQQQIESNKTSLVHVATHGRFGRNIENTFLQAYQSKISLTELEKTLSAHNINFPNNPIILMVLSACDTAVSDPRATLGMSGVAARSGVDNTLGSLWSVNDQQIVTLINAFYNNWIKDELSLSEAG